MSKWYDNSGVISIGAQCGGNDNGLGEIKVDLRNQFFRHCQSSYCPAVAHYAIALRIDGEFTQFGPESIERIRRFRRDQYIGVDIVIPKSARRGKSINQLRDYLAKQVRAALRACVARLKKDKEQVDETRLFAEVDAAIAEFKQWDYSRRQLPPR